MDLSRAGGMMGGDEGSDRKKGWMKRRSMTMDFTGFGMVPCRLSNHGMVEEFDGYDLIWALLAGDMSGDIWSGAGEGEGVFQFSNFQSPCFSSLFSLLMWVVGV